MTRRTSKRACNATVWRRPGVRCAGLASERAGGDRGESAGRRRAGLPGGFAGVVGCRDGRQAGAGRGCAWSGGQGGVPAPVVQELAEVVDGAEEFDLGGGGVAAAVVEVAAEPGVELGERGLDQGGAAPVQLLAGRGGQPGG